MKRAEGRGQRAATGKPDCTGSYDLSYRLPVLGSEPRITVRGARQGKKAEEGFSLIEALVAQALLMVGLLSAAQMIGLAVAQGAQARAASLAATLAQQKMEALAGRYAAGMAPEGGEETLRIENLAEPGPALAIFKRRWSAQAGPRGDYYLEVRVSPASAGRAPPGAVQAATVVLRTRLAPWRR